MTKHEWEIAGIIRHWDIWKFFSHSSLWFSHSPTRGGIGFEAVPHELVQSFPHGAALYALDDFAGEGVNQHPARGFSGMPRVRR